jgi:hypothetical protein
VSCHHSVAFRDAGVVGVDDPVRGRNGLDEDFAVHGVGGVGGTPVAGVGKIRTDGLGVAGC